MLNHSLLHCTYVLYSSYAHTSEIERDKGVLTVVVFGETGSKALSLFASCDLLAVYICVAFQTVH